MSDYRGAGLQRCHCPYVCVLIQEKCDIDAITGGVHTALHLATDEGNADIVELLVGHGIDLDVIDERGMTALHIVVNKMDFLHTIIDDKTPELKKV